MTTIDLVLVRPGKAVQGPPTDENRPLFSFRFDNFVQLDLAYHF